MYVCGITVLIHPFLLEHHLNVSHLEYYFLDCQYHHRHHRVHLRHHHHHLLDTIVPGDVVHTIVEEDEK